MIYGEKIMKKISFILLIFCVILGFTVTVHGQEFEMEASERLMRSNLRGDMFDVPSVKGNMAPAEGGGKPSAAAPASSDEELDEVQFPTADDIMAKSDVSHIDPATYELGPGDNFNILFYGGVSQNNPVSVQPNGTVFLAPAGPIHVEGLTLEQAQQKIFSVISKYYKNTKVEVQLTKLRTFQVEILGEVVNPGTYVVNPTVGACDAIGLAEGLKNGASLRNVVLKNLRNETKQRIDLFTWFFLADEEENVPLRKGDVVHVPLMQERVSVEGFFKRTGPFELVEGETLLDLVKMVEPGNRAKLDETKITRLEADKSLKLLHINLREVVNNPESPENVVLADGDVVFLPKLSIFLKKITVIGELEGTQLFDKLTNSLTGQQELMKMGQYELREGETVKDLVVALGGPTAQADLNRARIERPVGEGLRKIIHVDLNRLLNEDDESQNVCLEAGDVFVVPAERTNVYMVGEIRAPGAYRYNVGNTLKEYVAMAGGPTRRARMRQTRVVSNFNGETVVRTVDLRSILTGNAQDFELNPGDVIYLPYSEIISYKDVVQQITDLIVILQLFKD